MTTNQNERKRPSRAWTETVAGLSAGAASTLAVHPLDVIKTRLQSKLLEPYGTFYTLIVCK